MYMYTPTKYSLVVRFLALSVCLTPWIRLLYGELNDNVGALDKGDDITVVHVGDILAIDCDEFVIDVQLLAYLGWAARHQATYRNT